LLLIVNIVSVIVLLLGVACGSFVVVVRCRLLLVVAVCWCSCVLLVVVLCLLSFLLVRDCGLFVVVCCCGLLVVACLWVFVFCLLLFLRFFPFLDNQSHRVSLFTLIELIARARKYTHTHTHKKVHLRRIHEK